MGGDCLLDNKCGSGKLTSCHKTITKIMATVLHGRRKGKDRVTPEMPFNNNMQQHGPGMMLPSGTDLRDVTVLSKADWNRIQQQLHKKQIEEERIRKIREEKEKRSNISK